MMPPSSPPQAVRDPAKSLGFVVLRVPGRHPRDTLRAGPDA